MASFVIVTPLWSPHSSKLPAIQSANVSLFSLRSKRSALITPRRPPCRRHTFPVATVTEGWANTRQNLSSLEIDFTWMQNDRAENDLPAPGVHFVTPPALTGPDLMSIVVQDSPDGWVNEIVRTLLGWQQKEDGSWNNSHVPSMWLELYPDNPPDFIGRNNDYSPEHDRPVKIAVQRLVRSVRRDHSQLLKPALRPYGFRGWKIDQLTPNLTRRAAVTNWILHWYKCHYPDYKWE